MPLRGRAGWGVVTWTVALAVAAGLSPGVGAQGPASGSDGDLEISEVRADAGRGAEEAAFEWVEIRNRSAAAVDVEGWSLADNRGADALPAIRLAPGERVVVGGSAALGSELAVELPEGAQFVVVEDGRIGNGLANSGDRVVLIDAAGVAVDGVSWGSDRTITVLPVPARGQTLSRDGEGGWVAGAPSPGSGGPKAVEVVVGPPAALRIVEIFANAGEGSRDAAFEWVEIENPTSEAVDLGGWELSDNASTDVLASVRVGPGELIVVAATTEAAASAPVGAGRVIVEDGRLGNGLANTGDVVSLRDPAGRLVDEVDYRGPPLPRPEAGRSIALTDGGWVLNTEPSPGSDAVTPLLAGLGAPSPDSAVVRKTAEAEGGGGVPAWGLVAIALGAPLTALGGREAWRRRRALRARMGTGGGR